MEAVRPVELPHSRPPRSDLAGPEAGAGKRVSLLRPPPRSRRRVPRGLASCAARSPAPALEGAPARA